MSGDVAQTIHFACKNHFVGENQQETVAAALGTSRTPYTLAGGRRGTLDLTPAEIEEKAQAVREQGLDRGRTTQVLYIFFCCQYVSTFTHLFGLLCPCSRSHTHTQTL
jgi:hypothetical protein